MKTNNSSEPNEIAEWAVTDGTQVLALIWRLTKINAINSSFSLQIF